MAQRPATYTYSFPYTGSFTLSTITGLPKKTWIKSLTMRTGKNNSADTFWSDGGMAGGYLQKSEGCTFDFGREGTLVATLSIAGASGDVVYLTIGVGDDMFSTVSLT
jgi:hypothetical protein